jgi:hypothetical protein
MSLAWADYSTILGRFTHIFAGPQILFQASTLKRLLTSLNLVFLYQKTFEFEQKDHFGFSLLALL